MIALECVFMCSCDSLGLLARATRSGYSLGPQARGLRVRAARLEGRRVAALIEAKRAVAGKPSLRHFAAAEGTAGAQASSGGGGWREASSLEGAGSTPGSSAASKAATKAAARAALRRAGGSRAVERATRARRLAAAEAEARRCAEEFVGALRRREALLEALEGLPPIVAVRVASVVTFGQVK